MNEYPRLASLVTAEVPPELDAKILIAAKFKAAQLRQRRRKQRMAWTVGIAAAALLAAGIILSRPEIPASNRSMNWLELNDWSAIEQENYIMSAELNCGRPAALFAGDTFNLEQEY